MPGPQGVGLWREAGSSTCRPSASLPGSRAPTTKGDAIATAPSDKRGVRQAGRGQPKPQSKLFDLLFKIKGLGSTLRSRPYAIALFDLCSVSLFKHYNQEDWVMSAFTPLTDGKT